MQDNLSKIITKSFGIGPEPAAEVTETVDGKPDAFYKIELIPVDHLRELRDMFLKASNHISTLNALSILLTRVAVDMDVLVTYCEAGRMKPLSPP